MTSTVAKDNLVAVPTELAAELAIVPGTILSWEHASEPGVLRVKVLKGRAETVASLLGAGRKYLKPGEDPIAQLISERARDDQDRDAVV